MATIPEPDWINVPLSDYERVWKQWADECAAEDLKQAQAEKTEKNDK